MPGKFITFEGGEGVGKSTQIQRLAERLRQRGIDVTVTREPGGSEKAEQIRKFILSGKARPLGAEGEAILFASARLDHLEKTIRPALEKGEWVLCDRFADSTRAYQGADGVGGAMLDVLERVTLDGLKPDLTLLIDLAANEGLARARARAGEAEGPDRFESDNLARHRQRREAFLDLAKREPDRIVKINGGASVDKVAEEIWSVVSERFDLGGVDRVPDRADQ